MRRRIDSLTRATFWEVPRYKIPTISRIAYKICSIFHTRPYHNSASKFRRVSTLDWRAAVVCTLSTKVEKWGFPFFLGLFSFFFDESPSYREPVRLKIPLNGALTGRVLISSSLRWFRIAILPLGASAKASKFEIYIIMSSRGPVRWDFKVRASHF